nr:MAG TPA: hypothetical protein [Caudoviricetes sp.]
MFPVYAGVIPSAKRQAVGLSGVPRAYGGIMDLS